jgi:hypothetical protein
MHARIEHAVREALAARRMADACVDVGRREQWLKIAQQWDELIMSYEELQKLRDSALSAVVKPGRTSRKTT